MSLLPAYERLPGMDRRTPEIFLYADCGEKIIAGSGKLLPYQGLIKIRNKLIYN
jgi:hypothetical protein